MPEEINRLATDAVCDVLYASEEAAVEALRREGHASERVAFVGNVMIDTLDRQRRRRRPPAPPSGGGWSGAATSSSPCTAPHGRRPGAAGRPRRRRRAGGAGRGGRVAGPPAHARPAGGRGAGRAAPRPRGGPPERAGRVPRVPRPPGERRRRRHRLGRDPGGDDGPGRPCLTLRPSTERPATVAYGTNQLVALDPDAVGAALDEVAAGRWPRGERPPLWDGHAAERIADDLAARFG